MTRKKEEATAGLRRGRTLATAGLGAVTLIGGLVYAAPANAATPPTVKVVAPAQIPNDNTTINGLTIEVNNTATGHAAITDAALGFKVTIPAGLTCGDVTIASWVGPDTAGPAISDMSSASTTGTCSYQMNLAAGVADNSDVTYDYSIAVNGTQTHPGAPTTYVTGTISTVGLLEQTDATGTYQSTIATSAAANSTLLTAGAASFNTAAVPPATIYQSYSYDLLANPGYPTDHTDFTAVGVHKNADGTYTPSAAQVPVDTTKTDANGNELYNIVLSAADAGGTVHGGDFAFQIAESPTGQVVSGNLINVNPLNNADNNPYFTWTIIANNSLGGASGVVAANGYTPALAAGDVASPAFTPAVLFKDVTADSPFATDIYTLSNAGIINGQVDGTFGVDNAVTRGSFAAFAIRELNAYLQNKNGDPAGTVETLNGVTLNSGHCNVATNPSPFSDVANSSQFCSEIGELSSLGVVEGYTDGTFREGMKLSRQVVAGTFYRIEDAVKGAQVTDAAPVNTKFADVQSDNLFSGDINWAVNSGPTQIINGYGDGTFRPTGVATRQVTAAYLARFAQDYLGLFGGVTGL